MSDITVTFKNQPILTMDANGSKPLLTRGKYCEDDITIAYVKPSGGSGVTFDEMATGTYSGDVVLTVDRIKEQAFSRSGITSVSSQSVAQVGANAFVDCHQLVSANFSGLINLSGSLVGSQMFFNCKRMTSIGFPELIWVADSMFRACTAIVYGIFPKAEHIHQNSLLGCISLQAVDVGAKATGALTAANNLIHGSSAFSGCTVLNKLIIRQTNRIMALNNINAFNNTPFADGKAGGTLYVPQALIASYEAATNWSTILGYANNSIAAIEGSIYENAYADGTPIT